MSKLKEKDEPSGPMPQMRVLIDYTVYQKIMYMVNKAPGEVSGLGKGEWLSNGAFKVTSAILIKQENGAASTDIDAAAITKAMYELRDEPGLLNFWWHSHVDFAVFWSGTDQDTIRELGNNGFLVATVFNKKNEMLSAFYSKATDIFPCIYLPEIETKVMHFNHTETTAKWDKEYEEKCTVKTYPSTYSGNWYGDDWYNSDGYTTKSSWRKGRVWDEVSREWVDPIDPELEELDREVRELSKDDTLSNDEKDEMICMALRDLLEVPSKQMQEEKTYNQARTALNNISRIINKVKFFKHENMRALKAEYIGVFNQMYPAGSKTPEPKITGALPQ